MRSHKSQTSADNRSRAAKLIEELDKLAQSGEYGEVALVSSHGCIFSWQTKKLQNLQRSIEHNGQPSGFIGLHVAGNDQLHITAWPLLDEFEMWKSLVGSIEHVWEMLLDGHAEKAAAILDRTAAAA